MPKENFDYQLFFKLIETYGPSGFMSIGSSDPLVLEAEEMMEKYDQFFYFGDLLQYKILYTSKRSVNMLGIEPERLTPAWCVEAGHPDELNRHLAGRTILLKTAYDLFKSEKGYKILSSNYRIKNADGQYNNLLMQFYIYYSAAPYKSVFLFKLDTNINSFKLRRSGYHYYFGDDLSNFRYPDNELLNKRIIFSKREFDIIKLVEQGNNSEQIAEKLFLSKNTIDTHRRNILHKAHLQNMSELIYTIKEQGIL